jgi:hypothetical protein
MSYEVTTFDVENLRVRIVQDEDPMNPRIEYENVARFALAHKRYNLGDTAKTLGWTFRSEEYDGWDEVETRIQQKFNPLVIEPVSLHDHGGISLSLGVSKGWDSGQVGFAYVTREDMERNWSKETVAAMTDEERLERARKCIEGELECYSSYLEGDVWGFVVEKRDECLSCKHEEWQELESCWGFYGTKDAEDAGRDAAESITRYRRGKQEQFNDAKEVL